MSEDGNYRTNLLPMEKKYGGLMPSELKRLRQLEKENGRLKKIVADLNLDLQMRLKLPKRRVSCSIRCGRTEARKRNHIWSMDFVSDQLYNGRKLRFLTIVDNFTRVSPLIGTRFQYKAVDVVKTLDRAIAEHRVPEAIQVDNGPEFISKELDLWAYANKVELKFSRPGKHTDNAFIESFNGRFRQECLNQHWFISFEEAERHINDWRNDYNNERPHSSLGNLTPKAFSLEQKV